MITGTFNGWDIVSMPSSPAAKSIEFTAEDVVGAFTSSFTGQQQTYDWSAAWLEASVSLPPLTQSQAQPWIAFLLQLRGVGNVFQRGAPSAPPPAGSGSGTPQVNGAGQTGTEL